MIGVLVVLFVSSLIFDRLVGAWEEKQYDRGYTAFLVALGVGYTVALMGLVIGLRHMLYVLAGFAASGGPMIAGSVMRYVRQRDEVEQIAERRLRERLEGELSKCRYDDESEGTFFGKN